MKPKTILTLLLAAVAISAQAQQKKVVELPPAMFANNTAVEINKVTLSDTETVLDINAYYTPGYWIKIVSDTYLLADGKKYMIRSGEGIDLDSLFWMPKSGEAEFKLIFEPLPINTPSFDFMEGDCDDCFKIYGIDLVNKRAQLPALPAEYTKEHLPETSFQAELEKGIATVSGRLMGYVPMHEKFSLVYLNPLTGSETTQPVTINTDGFFTASITVYNPTQLLFTNRKNLTASIRVAPGKESKIWINLPEIYRSGSHLLKEKPSYGSKFNYAGYFARLNTDLANQNISKALNQDFRNEIADMDINQYKDFIMAKYREAVEHNNNLGMGELAKKISEYELAFGLANHLSMAKFALTQAYAMKHGVSPRDTEKTIDLTKAAKSFSDFYHFIPYNDPNLLLSKVVAYDIRNLSFAQAVDLDKFIVMRFIAQNEEVNPEDRQLIKEFLIASDNNEEFSKTEDVMTVANKYRSLGDAFLKQQTGMGYLSKIWKTDECFLFDIMKSQEIAKNIDDFNPLTKEQKSELANYPPIIRQVLLKQNEELLTRIEENKKKTGYTVLNPPANVDEQLFLDLMAPFKGKVILVDVWATWCGPCRAAHTAMEPMKAQFADKDVVFLYLAGEDSPENTWKNMIADIKGQHYRVNQAQWDYLRTSLNAAGVPTYLIIDRDGNHSFHSVGFPGIDAMKRELNKALNKK